jgi:hypothetical protein
MKAMNDGDIIQISENIRYINISLKDQHESHRSTFSTRYTTLKMVVANRFLLFVTFITKLYAFTPPICGGFQIDRPFQTLHARKDGYSMVQNHPNTSFVSP